LTPLEHKETRAEGVREAEMEIFKVSHSTLSHPFVHLTGFIAGEKRIYVYSIAAKATEKW